jgi:hypothetical protein
MNIHKATTFDLGVFQGSEIIATLREADTRPQYDICRIAKNLSFNRN